MKTLHAYIGRFNGKTLKISNEYPDNCTSVYHSYWSEDFVTSPDLSKAQSATFDDIERMADFEDIKEVIINRCK